MSITRVVREFLPLRYSANIVTPNGRTYRWGDDEPRAENVLADLVKSSTMPGGFERSTMSLARDTSRSYGDLAPLSTITIRDAGGGVVGEYRLEETPRESGDVLVISPQAVGWQASLADNECPGVIYVDQDAGQWTDMPLARKINLGGTSELAQVGFSSEMGGIVWDLPNVALPDETISEAWYRAPAGDLVSKLAYIGARTGAFTGVEAPLVIAPLTDDGNTITSASLTLDGTLRTVPIPTPTRYALLRYYLNSGPQTPAKGDQQRFELVAAYGSHGLPLYPIDATVGDGVLSSDVEAHILSKLCPLINYTTGANGTIQPSNYVLAQLALRDLVNAQGVLDESTKFELREYAIWEKRTYYANDRGARGRRWRARVGPSQLHDTGPSVKRTWNAVLIAYRDVDGTTRTVGPPGSGADVEDARLLDSDAANPANELGIIRCRPLAIGISTPEGAILYGVRFLFESKLVDNSGEAFLVGYVEDDRGIVHPVTDVRGGDWIAFTDAHDTSYRYIVREEYTDSNKTCTVQLDAPPDGMQQLLERYSDALAPFGLGG